MVLLGESSVDGFGPSEIPLWVVLTINLPEQTCVDGRKTRAKTSVKVASTALARAKSRCE